MNKLLTVVLLLLFACSANQNVGGFKSHIELRDVHDKVFLTIKRVAENNRSAIGILHDEADGRFETVISSWEGNLDMDSLILFYQGSLTSSIRDSIGALLVVTDHRHQNDFRLLNYEVPDSAFYANRLAIGMRSKNIEFGEGSPEFVSRIYFYPRK